MVYDQDRNVLLSRVEYEVVQKLTSEQEIALIDYTIGQLTDGIGDNLAQEYVNKTGVMIRPAVSPYEAKTTYVE